MDQQLDPQLAKLAQWLDNVLGDHFDGYVIIGYRRGAGVESPFRMVQDNQDPKTLHGLTLMTAGAAGFMMTGQQPPDQQAA